MKISIKRSLLEYVLGRRNQLDLGYDQRSAMVIFEAADASRDLLIKLRSLAPIVDVQRAMERRQVAAQRFERVIGEVWKL